MQCKSTERHDAKQQGTLLVSDEMQSVFAIQFLSKGWYKAMCLGRYSPTKRPVCAQWSLGKPNIDSN